MNIMSLDLEMNQPSGAIIEVGVTVGNVFTGEVLFKQSIMVKPPKRGIWPFRKTEKISSFITNLTTITDKDVSKGCSIKEAALAVDELHKDIQCMKMILTWGGGDHYELKRQSGVVFKSIGHSYFDAKKLYQTLRLVEGQKIQRGLATAMTKLGLRFVGTKHTAADDSLNTFTIFYKMLEKLRGLK